MSSSGIEVDRVQWGVGNGGFHTEDLRTRGEPYLSTPLVRVVYDCGSMRSGTVVSKEIIAWGDATGGLPLHTDQTSVLVISHFDRDHVNGLRLLHAAGFSPTHVILPYLPPHERVLQLLANISAEQRTPVDQQDDADDQLAAWITGDPNAAIREFWPEALVTSVDDEPPNDADFPTEDDGRDSEEDAGESPVTVSVAPTRGIRLITQPTSSATSSRVIWEYHWRVHRPEPSASSNLSKNLVLELAKALGMEPKHIASPKKLWEQIAAQDAWKIVAGTYKSYLATTDLNPYSLILWSGPGPDAKHVWSSRGLTIRNLRPVEDSPLRAWGRSGSWLGTGDARLLSQADVDLLFSRVGRRVEDVDVMNAPHHGSRHNSNDNLYGRVPAQTGVIVANADGKNGWHHPHGPMVKSALSQGHAVIRVGDSSDQRFLWSVVTG